MAAWSSADTPAMGGAVVIPAAIGGRPVTGIGDFAFEDRAGLASVTIPASVTRIGDRAFTDCAALTAVSMTEGLAGIGDLAFAGCTGLPAISVSVENQKYKDIDGVVFSRDGKTLVAYPPGGKTDYLIPEGVTRIGNTAFSYCTGLASVTVPEGVTSIGYAAFSRCSGLVSITIPDSVISVDEGAFRGCGKLDKASRGDIEDRFGEGVF
jgi:hypothetical protein